MVLGGRLGIVCGDRFDLVHSQGGVDCRRAVHSVALEAGALILVHKVAAGFSTTVRKAPLS